MVVLFILLGLLVGCFSGIVGIGGGILIVPALVFLFKFSQQTAQGTTLALLVPPIGIFAAIEYYRAGHADIRVAALIAVGFIIGSILGARFALLLPVVILSRIFGVVLILVGIRMLFH